MKAVLKTLSPVHIGSGDKITSWAYGVDNNRINIYRFEDIVNALAGNIHRIENLKSQMERFPLTKSAGEIIKEFNLNVSPSYSVELVGNIKDKEDNYKQIFEFIKQSGKVYIPATEIKGAIRTAVMYVILKELFDKNQKEKDEFILEIEGLLGIRDKKQIKEKITKKIIPDLERKAFRKGNDIKTDMFRFLQVSDSDLKYPADVLRVVEVKAVGISKTFYELHEVLKEGTEFAFDIDIKYNPKIHSSAVSPNAKRLSIDFIKDALREFYTKVLEEDIKYFKNSDFVDVKALEKERSYLKNQIYHHQ